MTQNLHIDPLGSLLNVKLTCRGRNSMRLHREQPPGSCMLNNSQNSYGGEKHFNQQKLKPWLACRRFCEETEMAGHKK